jgi:outer membrane protein assembly factor BamB
MPAWLRVHRTARVGALYPAAMRWRRPRALGLAIGIGIVLLLAGGAALFLRARAPHDVSHPEVEFRPETPAPAPPPKKARRKAHRFVWPFYGYTADRRRFFAAPSTLRPPFVRMWAFRARSLLEFNPIMVGRWLFVIANDGRLYSISKHTGRVRWKRRIGVLAAESPAYANGRVCVTVLNRAAGLPGRAACLRARDGRLLWSRILPSRAESSPVIDSGRVYFGSEDGTVYAMRLSDGAVRWRFRAQGAVKGGLALVDGRLYFGDYAGKVYAIRQADGHEVWRVGTSGARLGLSSGRFYSTPAVAYGRVYIGNTDGFVYSFAARDGRLAWRTHTDAYVYGSPAVADVEGGPGPTVYIGSYDGTFYALNARSGSVRWRHRDGGKISGGATVIGDVVYFSNWGKRTSMGLGARTGRVVWRSRFGSFNAMISDGAMMVQTGTASLYGLRRLSRRGR